MEATTQPAMHDRSTYVACASCQRPTTRAGKFCGDCGARLWEPCLNCEATNSVAESYCAQCGADLRQAVAEASKQLDDILQSASRLEAEGKLLESIERLATVPAIAHSALAARVHEARRLRQVLIEKREQAVANLSERLREAQRLMADRHYGQALACLEGIPTSLRNQQAQSLLSELQATVQEIARLRAQVRDALQQGGLQFLPIAVERLHELQPHAEDVQRLWQQLRGQRRKQDAVLTRKLLEQARSAVQAHDYPLAGACLRKMPDAPSDRDQELCEAVQERVWLARQVTLAPFADKTLLAIAERLVKLQPNDKKAAEWHTKLIQRLTRRGGSERDAFVPWAKAPSITRFAAPVEPLPSTAGLSWDANDDQVEPWIREPWRYATCVGLALAGLNRAKLDLDLRPDKTLLERLSPARTLRRPTAAWGLDLAASGLKFVKLAVGKDGEVHVAAAGILTYAAEQPSVDQTDVTRYHAAAVATFVEQRSDDAPIVVGLPGTESLSRFFRLPPMKRDRRFQTALEIEVRNQIPLPLEEVGYGTHVGECSPCDAESARQWAVSLAAAKRIYLQRRLGPFAAAGVKIASLQSDGVALLAALHHFCGDQFAALLPDRSIALVDVGRTATIVAVASSAGGCFRAIHQGTRNFSKGVSQAHGVTLQQSDELLRHWERAEAMFRLDAATAPAIEDLTRAVEHALRSAADALGTKLARVFVAGGGCKQFGLFRQWTHPQELDDVG